MTIPTPTRTRWSTTAPDSPQDVQRSSTDKTRMMTSLLRRRKNLPSRLSRRRTPGALSATPLPPDQRRLRGDADARVPSRQAQPRREEPRQAPPSDLQVDRDRAPSCPPRPRRCRLRVRRPLDGTLRPCRRQHPPQSPPLPPRHPTKPALSLDPIAAQARAGMPVRAQRRPRRRTVAARATEGLAGLQALQRVCLPRCGRPTRRSRSRRTRGGGGTGAADGHPRAGARVEARTSAWTEETTGAIRTTTATTSTTQTRTQT